MSTAHLLMVLAAVWLATAGCVFGFAWEARGCIEQRRAAPVPYRLTLDGYRVTSPFQGAADPAFEAPAQIDRLAMLDDAMALVEQRATADEVRREVELIWAEIEANPERWQA